MLGLLNGQPDLLLIQEISALTVGVVASLGVGRYPDSGLPGRFLGRFLRRY
jgi:hypothetical protein